MGDVYDRLLSWRPHIPNSIDGDPLAVRPSELLSQFPYERLPSDPFLSYLERPLTPFLLVVSYIAGKTILQSISKALGLNGRSSVFTAVVAAHNLFLAAFSALMFLNTKNVVLDHLAEYGWEATYCDRDNTLWASGLGAWSTLFYLSKYYEFLDTYILVIKGKTPSMLQIYHHCGIVFTMWGAVVTQGAWMLMVVLLNSFIHTLMYSYFFVKTVNPAQEIKAAKYLTMAQIGQFITGITYGLGVHVLGETCDTSASRLVMACLQIYGLGLILLFAAFAAKKYNARKNKTV